MRVENLIFSPSTSGFGMSSEDSNISSSRRMSSFFSFISLIQREAQPWRIFRYISTFYPIVQNILISMWPHLLHEKGKIPIYDEILTNIFFLYTLDPGNSAKMYGFVISSILLSIFSMIILFFVPLIYFTKKFASMQLLYLFNFCMHVINPIIIIPLGFQSGGLIVTTFRYDSQENEINNYFYSAMTVLSTILLVLTIITSFCTYIFDASSIYIADSQFMSFDGFFQSCVMVIPSVICMLSFVLELFHPYMLYVSVGLHLVYCLTFFVWLFWMPIGQLDVNHTYAAFLCGMIVLDFLCFVPKVHDNWYGYILILAIIFVSYFFMKLVFRKRAKSIISYFISSSNDQAAEANNINILNNNSIAYTSNKIMHNTNSNNNVNNLSSLSKNSNTNMNGLFNYDLFSKVSVKESLFVLRIALMFKHCLFTNGQLVESISRNAKTDEERIMLARLICYFPEFQPIFIAQLAMLRRAHSLPLTKAYLLYQLRKLEICQQKLAKVEELNDISVESASISLRIRSIWQQVEFNNQRALFQTFDWLSLSAILCKKRWEEVLSNYPHNSILAEEYSRFLIECLGDFSAAAEWHTMSQQLQEGKIFRYDSAMVHLLRAYPHYAKQILPKNKIVNIEDIDIQTKHESLGRLVENPELRVEFQRATHGSYPDAINYFFFNSILMFLFVFLFWLIFIIASFNRYQRFVANMKMIYDTTMLTQQISITFLPVIFAAAEVPIINRMPTHEEMIAIYGNDRIKHPERELINMSHDYKETVSLETELGMILLNNLHNSILDQILKGNTLQLVLDAFFNDTLPSEYYLSKSDSITTTTNLQSSLITFFTTLSSISWRRDDTWIDDISIYNAVNGGTQLLEQMDIISSAFIENDQLLFKNSLGSLFKIMLAVYAFYSAISIILPWIVFFIIRHNFYKIFKKLSLFPKEIMEKGSDSIIIKPSREYTSDVINIEPTIRNVMVLSLCFTTFLSIIILCGFVEVQIKGEKKRDCFQTHSKLVHQTSLRALRSAEVLYALLSSNIFGLVVPQISDKYDERLQKTIEKLVLTHEKCGIPYDSIGKNAAEEIDQIRMKGKCADDWPDKTLHETLACFSLDSAVVAYIGLANTLYKMKHDPGLLRSGTFVNFMHFLLSQFYYDLIKIPTLLIDSAENESNEFNSLILLIGIISVILACIQLSLNLTIFRRFISIFNLLFAFISRIPPKNIVENTELLNLMLNISGNISSGIGRNSFNRQEMSQEARMIQESSFPVLFLDRAGIIEGVNTSFTTTFGYESSYIICQPISVIIEDENHLSFIEGLKFGTHETNVREIVCRKENGQLITYSITFIPQAQHIALVFSDLTAIKVLQHRCNNIKSSNDKMVRKMYPSIIQSSIEGAFKVSAVCLIKLQNIGTELLPSRLISQRQDIFEQFCNMLQIYSLLTPLSQKNGVFAAIASGSSDPTELAIECLNYAFTVVDYFMTTASYGNFSAVVETADDVNVNLTDDEETQKLIISGNLIKRAQGLFEMNQVGKVIISETTYQFVLHHDLTFKKKKIDNSQFGNEYYYIVEYNHAPAEIVTFEAPSRSLKSMGNQRQQHNSNNNNRDNNSFNDLLNASPNSQTSSPLMNQILNSNSTSSKSIGGLTNDNPSIIRHSSSNLDEINNLSPSNSSSNVISGSASSIEDKMYKSYSMNKIGLKAIIDNMKENDQKTANCGANSEIIPEIDDEYDVCE